MSAPPDSAYGERRRRTEPAAAFDARGWWMPASGDIGGGQMFFRSIEWPVAEEEA